MHTDNESSKHSAEGMMESAEDSGEKNLQWLLDIELDEPEEKLFSLGAEEEADTVTTLIQERWLDPENEEHSSTYFLAALEARPSLSYLSFGMPSGKYYHAFRDRDGTGCP